MELHGDAARHARPSFITSARPRLHQLIPVNGTIFSLVVEAPHQLQGARRLLDFWTFS